MLQTPVCLIIFNRPDTTARVFAEIAKARPAQLLVVADGPRPDRPEEAERCAEARAIVERVDWECEVLKNYSSVNLGCGRRPASGISWVFEQVEEAIILEDDCVPLPSFFRFCEELLKRYRHDERVRCISGINLEPKLRSRWFSYRFSHFNLCLGWATWRRAWQDYDFLLGRWPALRKTSWLRDILEDPRAVELYAKGFDRAYESAGEVDYWDYQWTFACWAQKGLSILPSTGLVRNIGFGPDATHTTSIHDRRAFLPVRDITFPLRHPTYVHRARKADQRLTRSITLLNQPEEPGGLAWLRRRYQEILTRHPSLKSPRDLSRRLGERCSTAMGRVAGKWTGSL